ncbi:MAG: O-antigen ligase family protein [Ruminococcus sp.]|nr:O-antigen ligase family protein [Ruminococcus sp.]
MAERKHLFGTSDKSDFIVNMTDAGAKKLCAMYCIIAMAIIELIAIPYYFTKNVVDYYDTFGELQMPHYLSDKVIYWAAVVMFGLGILGFSIFIIGRMKKQISLKDNKALLWMAGIIVMSLISALASSEINNAMTGYQDRAEGFLTLIGYYGFFAAAFTVVAEDWKKRVCAAIITIGAVNAVIGILQVIPALEDIVPNWFTMLNVTFTQGIKVPAANGLAMTPHALAAILTVSFAAALTAVCFARSLPARLLSGAAAVLMVAAGVFTRTVTAYIGLGCSALFVLIIAVCYAAKDSSSEPEEAEEDTEPSVPRKSVLAGLLCGLAAAACAVAVLAVTDNVELHDEEVIRTDSIRMLMLLDREDSDTWIYPYLWDDGLYVTEQNPLLGTGPDNWATIYSHGLTIDRTYNEYIDTAMQRGVITAGLYLIFLLITLYKAVKAVAGFVKGRLGWGTAAASAAAAAYMVQAFFNISALTSTPFFFICAGLVWSTTAKKKSRVKKQGGK